MNKPTDFDAACRRRSWLARLWADLRYQYRGLDKVFVGLPAVADTLTRHLDRFVGRSYNGVWQRLFIQGHSLVPMLFMLVAIVFTVLGPTPRFRGWPAVGGMFAAVAVYWLFVRLVLARRTDGRGLLSFQMVVLAVLAVVYTVWLPAEGASEALPAPYRNLFAPTVLLLLTLAMVSGGVAWWVMRGFPDADRALFAELLTKTELFVRPRPPQPTLRRLLHGFINAPLYHPLHLLLMPALPLIAMAPQYIVPVGAALLAFAWLLLTFTGMYDRLGLMITVVRHFFLIGGQLVVSLVIIGLALARVAGIEYVSTVLDSASALVILYYVLAAYTVFWLYEYWINRALAERMLPLLQCAHGTPRRMTWSQYAIEAGAVATNVLARQRAVEVFSGSRFAVTGAYRDANSQTLCAAWQSYDKTELFERLAQSARDLSHWSAEQRYQANVAAAELVKRTKLYFNFMNLLLLGVLVTVGLLLHHDNPQRSGVLGYRVDAAQVARQPASLGQLVFDRRHADNKVILLAASGGGTRAALYTASALRGIAAMGRLGDVVLVSGVSGGSAALAYFAIHRQALLKQPPGPCNEAALQRLDSGDRSGADPWCVFIATMAYPYIEDVLRGASEVEVSMSKSFGHLLEESFGRNFGVHPDKPVTLATIADLGLILNTTLAGHPASESTWLNGLYRGHAPAEPTRAYASGAGGRLVFTNLRELAAFPRPAQALAHAQDEFFQYVLVGGERTSLSAAAALSANFPPVFSNAGVDVFAGPQDTSAGQRYWVTDGGAADNRGIISLLYALHSMLDACQNRLQCQGAPPEIHIIVADASAATVDYQSDRGGGSILGAANKFASQLMLELIASAERKYQGLNHGRLVTHYLPMPAVLRTRGGLGTHWMMPQAVTLTDICGPDGRRASKVSVDRLPLMEMMVDLHATPAAPPPLAGQDCQAPRPAEARGWLATDRHARAWSDIATALALR